MGPLWQDVSLFLLSDLMHTDVPNLASYFKIPTFSVQRSLAMILLASFMETLDASVKTAAFCRRTMKCICWSGLVFSGLSAAVC